VESVRAARKEEPARHPAVKVKKKCKDCRRVPPKGARRCAACAKRHTETERARRELRRQQGLCVVCGAEAFVVEGVKQSLCAEHRERLELRRAALRT